jgi:hypothetical protein
MYKCCFVPINIKHQGQRIKFKISISAFNLITLVINSWQKVNRTLLPYSNNVNQQNQINKVIRSDFCVKVKVTKVIRFQDIWLYQRF